MSLHPELEETLTIADEEYWGIRYEDLRFSDNVLGRGQAGQVRGAVWRGTPVAVKYYRCNAWALHEFSVLRLLHHPNIVQLLGICRSPDGRVLLICERLDGITLDRVFSSSGDGSSCAPPRRSYRWVHEVTRQILLALRYLHEHRPQPIAHRDLKGANILIVHPDKNPHVKILDFGLSRVGKPPPSDCPSGVGTPLYMAPELRHASTSDAWRHHLSHEDALRQTDMYALGVLLRMLWEQMPVRETIPWCHTPPRIRRLVDACLRTDPSHRPRPSQLLVFLPPILPLFSGSAHEEGRQRRSTVADWFERQRYSFGLCWDRLAGIP